MDEAPDCPVAMAAGVADRWEFQASRLVRMHVGMQSSTCIVWLMYAGALAVGPTAESGAQTVPSETRGAAELVAALTRHRLSLLDVSQRSKLEEIERHIRDSGALQDSAKKNLLKLLNSVPSVVRVTVADNLATTTPTEPVRLPGDAGALLLRVQSGEAETQFVSLPHDLSSGEDAIRFEVSPTGVTWALIELNHVPVERTSLLLKLDGIIDRWIPFLVDVASEPSGRLAVTVLSADGVQPVPAMVRLLWKTDGSTRKPSNAIELAPHFEHQGEWKDPRQANLPGRRGGAYWCVPGPFDMSLPPGDWEITIRRGVEHTPIEEAFTIKPGQSLQKTYRLQRWVDMPKRGWYSGDAHVHFRMTSDSDARHMMAWAQAEDIHVTNVLKMGDINRTWFEQRGFGPEHRYTEGDFVLVPGQECPRTHEQLGHILCLNTGSMVRDFRRYYLYDRVFDAVHAQSGLTGYAHVEANKFHVHRDLSRNVPAGRVDFVEVMQFGKLNTDLYYEFLNLGFKLTAAAGSDVPWGGTVGEVRMYARLGGEPFSADAWFNAVKRGRTFVTNGPMIELTVDGALPGDEIVVTGDRSLRVQARVWGDGDRMVPTVLEVVSQGEVLRRVVPFAATGSELALDFTVPSGHGLWIAARARCNDGSEAHTTPVYVIRKPLRFWKHANVQDLVRKRLDSLSEVEQMVATARDLDRAKKIDYHRSWKQVAIQSADLLSRVAAARRFYEDLLRSAEQERAIRAGE